MLLLLIIMIYTANSVSAQNSNEDEITQDGLQFVRVRTIEELRQIPGMEIIQVETPGQGKNIKEIVFEAAAKKKQQINGGTDCKKGGGCCWGGRILVQITTREFRVLGSAQSEPCNGIAGEGQKLYYNKKTDTLIFK